MNEGHPEVKLCHLIRFKNVHFQYQADPLPDSAFIPPLVQKEIDEGKNERLKEEKSRLEVRNENNIRHDRLQDVKQDEQGTLETVQQKVAEFGESVKGAAQNLYEKVAGTGDDKN
jgi:hypothetical protein